VLHLSIDTHLDAQHNHGEIEIDNQLHRDFRLAKPKEKMANPRGEIENQLTKFEATFQLTLEFRCAFF